MKHCTGHIVAIPSLHTRDLSAKAHQDGAGMTPLLFLTCVVAALLLGTMLGWASRRHAHWCPNCGGRLACVLCQPVSWSIAHSGYPANGRARVHGLTDRTRPAEGRVERNTDDR
jgi:hypothetical protein